jgi:hypothetical protein
MNGGNWLKLGWRHPLWDLVRFYLSLRGTKADEWANLLRNTSQMKLGDIEAIRLEPDIIELFFNYLLERERAFNHAVKQLRTEQEALFYCHSKTISVHQTRTRNQEHHQSSKAIVATVAAIVKDYCEPRNIHFNTNPQTRCAWSLNHKLHVSARNIDGAISQLLNPSIIWEIKEYWGVTGGGSKMSDAVYECNLVGRELREFEEQSGANICHIVFLDGKVQWNSRKSDLKRFIDLTYQGIIDYLFVGKDIETEFCEVLRLLLSRNGL